MSTTKKGCLLRNLHLSFRLVFFDESHSLPFFSRTRGRRGRGRRRATCSRGRRRRRRRRTTCLTKHSKPAISSQTGVLPVRFMRMEKQDHPKQNQKVVEAEAAGDHLTL
jgi:hypothetical protein